jgi:hypothetical protein
MLAVLLLSVVWASAQTTTTTPAETAPSSGQSSTTSPSTSGDSSMSQTSANGDWIQGCLNGSDGNYTLTDQSGNSYRLTGDTAKLSEHIGHEVKVSGTKSSATATGASEGNASSSSMGQTGGSQQTIQVSSVKHVSKTCQNSGTTTSK